MNKFDEYAHRYDMNKPEINYKYHHSYRVMDNMIVLAKNMNLSYCEIKIAKVIGLLHDIGRFEQFKRYQSFKDNYLDHADYGVEVIKKEKILDAFDIPKEDYEVVYKAIKNHNKYAIEPGLNRKELLFAKLIRDADKLDILYALSNPELKNIIREDDSTISKKVNDEFFANKQVVRDYQETFNENIVVIFSFAYDFNFNLSLDMLNYENYYDKIYARLDKKDMFKKYIDHVKEYIRERTE